MMTDRRLDTFACKVYPVLALLASFVCSGVRAQDIEIPCDGSPAAAVTQIPSPADHFVHVVCTRFGHVLNPVEGWFWTRPGAYSPVFFPAQMVQRDPKESGNSIYFSSITSTPLVGAAAQSKWTVLADIFPHDTPLDKALEIVATSSGGSVHTIFLFPNAWGYSCSPVCDKSSAFIMINRRKEPPNW